MKKRNIGRISFVIILINVIFLLIYLSNKNASNYEDNNSAMYTKMVIAKDETVDNQYLSEFERIVADNNYNSKEFDIILSYHWYFTDNILNTKTYTITNNKITVYANNLNDFKRYVTDVLSTILKEGN